MTSFASDAILNFVTDKIQEIHTLQSLKNVEEEYELPAFYRFLMCDFNV